jgi:hypothetical protein
MISCDQSGGVACSGFLDLRAQDEVPSALKSDTPLPLAQGVVPDYAARVRVFAVKPIAV